MPRPSAPSMPTKHQISEVHRIVTELHPDARIVRVGPEGVTWGYPDGTIVSIDSADRSEHAVRPLFGVEG